MSGYFNPRPPRGGRLTAPPSEATDTMYFNPRPPRGGRRHSRMCGTVPIIFQSTPPARGATSARVTDYLHRKISIHAPREGGDYHSGAADAHDIDFNPRPPRGGRLARNSIRSSTSLFQSTPPARGATRDGSTGSNLIAISIHAPREGGDFVRATLPRAIRVFQSTPPARGATYRLI